MKRERFQFYPQVENQILKRVTIKDVAREAGVSPAAVSRVFTKRASSSRKTQEKVLTAATLLGYRPSMVARGLVGYRTNLVTLVAGRMVDPFDAIFQDLLSETMARRGIQLLLASASSSESDDSGLLQALDYQSESVIVSSGTMSREHSEACVRAGLPIILMGRIVTHPGVDSVLADNANGARQAAELLLRTGCQRLVYLGRGGATFSDKERFQGFSDEVTRAEVSFCSHSVEDPNQDAVFTAAIAILSSSKRPDGVFCGSDSIAFGVIEAARALGLSIPEHLSVVGFNNVPPADWRSFRLTTIEYPIGRTIETIVNLLDKRLADPGRPSEVRRIPTQLIVRATTRKILPGA